jgi:WD40 repeat protein
MKWRGFVSILLFIAPGTDYLAHAVFASTLLWSTPPGLASRPLFNGDGTRILRGSKEAGLNIFDATSGSLLKTLPGSEAFVVPRDPTIVAQIDLNHTLSIVRIADGRVLRTSQNVGNVVFLDNGAMVYTTADGSEVFVTALEGGQEPTPIDVETDPMLSATGNRFLVSDISSDPSNLFRARLFSYENFALKEIEIGTTPELRYLPRLSADGKSIAGVEGDAVFVYDVETRSVRWRHPNAGSFISNVAWLADDAKVFVSARNTMTTLDAETGEVVWSKTGSASFADVSPDKKWLLGDDSTSSLYDAATGEFIRFNDFGFGPARGMTISPDRKRIAYANVHGDILCRDVDTGNIVWRGLFYGWGNGAVFRRLAATPDWSLLLATAVPGPLAVDTHVIDPKTGRLVKTIRTGMAGNSGLPNLGLVAASQDNKLFAVGDMDAVALVNMETGETIRSWRPEKNMFVISIAFVKNDQAIAVGLVNDDVKILPIDGGEIQRLTGGSGILNTSRDCALLAGREYGYGKPQPAGKQINIWRASDLTPHHTVTPATTPIATTFSDDSASLLIGGDREVTVWSMATGRQVGSIAAAESPIISSLAASGNYFAVSGPSNVQMYTALSGLRANLTDDSISLSWEGLMGPFTIQSAPAIEGPWTAARETEQNSVQLPIGPGQRFFRLQGP